MYIIHAHVHVLFSPYIINKCARDGHLGKQTIDYTVPEAAILRLCYVKFVLAATIYGFVLTLKYLSHRLHVHVRVHDNSVLGRK